MNPPNILNIIAKELKKRFNGSTIIVGGAVRDHFFNKENKDWDIEVYKVGLEELEEVLKEYGKVNLVGKSFGILKFSYQNEIYDIAIPRKEKKQGLKHNEFEVSIDKNLTFKEASIRRDFSMNAMGYDLITKEFLDPFNGKVDIKNRTLQYTNDKTFQEDPLRVYRAVQFCSRFELKLAPKTQTLCLEMVKRGDLDNLPKERIYTEFSKMLLKSDKPSIGLKLLRKLEILDYFVELKALIGTQQSPIYHPEGDVWTHTLLTVDEMAKIPQKNLKFMFAILCHDLGKPKTTTNKNGKIQSINHEKVGVEITKNFMYKLTNNHKFIDSLLPLIEHHLKPSQFYRSKSKPKAIRKLSTKVSIEELIIVAKADFLGRNTQEAKTKKYLAGEWLLSEAKKLKVEKEAPEPLLMGRDLINLGLKPSKKFKKILEESYNLQLNGEIETKEEAIKLIKNC